MRSVALVFAGGALGTLGRYAIGLALPGFWTTWVVNVTGSFALGLLLGWLGRLRLPRPPRREPAFSASRARVLDAHGLRLLLGTGFLGGFTTYSAFALDIVQLGMLAGPVLGLAAGAAQVAFGLVAALLGFLVAGLRDTDGRAA